MLDRSKIQKEVVELLGRFTKILLEWATGVGKSLAFILLQESIKDSTVLIVVAERLHINNWIAEYNKHNRGVLLLNVTFTCYNSLHKYKNSYYDFICMDEVHRVTPKRLEAIQEINHKYLVGLSATVGYSSSRLLRDYLGEFRKYKISLNTAIENKFVPEPKFYLHSVEADRLIPMESIVMKRNKASDKTMMCNYSDYKRIMFNKRFSGLNLSICCTQKQAIEYYDSQIEYYKEQVKLHPEKSWIQFKLNRLGLNRKNYLSSIKTKYIFQFLQTFNKRYICFCNDIKQIEDLTDSRYSVHSKKKNNDVVLDNFNKGIIDKIFAAKMMQEGMNLEDIEASVVAQLDTTSRTFIQKTGRSLRSKTTPEIHIFYVKDSSDEVYLKTSLEDINKNLIYYV